MATLNQTPSYFVDMAVVDERLKRLERAFEELNQLLTDLSMDLKLITNGGKTNGKQEEFNKSSKGQKSVQTKL